MKLLNFYVGILSLLFIATQLSGQIISINPSAFTMDDEITITYDATKGNGGLLGVDQVYAHTGVITESGGLGNWQNVQGNWGQVDPKVAMTNIGSEMHEITFTPRDFYNLNNNQKVIQLAFVFRNADGSREGKTSTLGDIFVDVNDPNVFSASFVAPEEQHIILELGETINFKVITSQISDIEMFENDIQVALGQGTALDYTFTADQAGDFLVRFIANNGTDEISSQISFVVDDGSINEQDPPIPLKNGLNRVDGSTAYLQLYAPMKKSVYILSNINDWQLSNNLKMHRSSDNNSWWIELNNLSPNSDYAYQYIIDGSLKIADPYSELILDDFNDGGIDPVLNSVPMEYPKNMTNGHISYFQTEKPEFDWQNTPFERPDNKDLVIYEILMRDFLEDHSYESLIDTLSYLRRLGVNALELMPVSEFENNQSWGYNPSYHMALDKYYGSPESFKKFVDAAHALDMVVILDIVYNHAFGQSPLVRMYWDQNTGKPMANGPYFNPDAKHPYNVGYDFNHARTATQTYTKQTIQYWIEEYKIDGFRFDLSKGFTQNQSNGDGAFSALDQSRINILTDYADFIWDIDDSMILILEHFAANDEEQILSDYGFLLWGNANFNFNEATMGYNNSGKSNFSHIYHENRNWNRPNLIGYMESHDEERLMYKNEQFGNTNGSYSTKDIPTGLDRVEMASSFFFSIPGPKMLWQFGELGYGYSINRCENGTVDPGCRLSPKPIRWDYQSEQDRSDLFNVTSKMIHLKKEYVAIREGEVDLNVSGALKSINLNHPDGNLVVVGNFDVIDGGVNPNFPHTGRWFDYLNDVRIEVNDPQKEILLAPGEYRVYLDDNQFVTSTQEVISISSLKVFPNPANQYIELQLSEEIPIQSLEIINLLGQTVLKFIGTDIDSRIDIDSLPLGTYLAVVQTESGRLQTASFIKE